MEGTWNTHFIWLSRRRQSYSTQVAASRFATPSRLQVSSQSYFLSSQSFSVYVTDSWVYSNSLVVYGAMQMYFPVAAF